MTRSLSKEDALSLGDSSVLWWQPLSLSRGDGRQSHWKAYGEGGEGWLFFLPGLLDTVPVLCLYFWPSLASLSPCEVHWVEPTMGGRTCLTSLFCVLEAGNKK